MSNARERVSGGLGRPRPGHLASLSGAHSPVSSAEACLCLRGRKGARETMGRTSTTLLPFSFLLNYCHYYWNTKREPLQRREARGTRKRNAKWLGCARSGLALFAGSHRSPLEENSSRESTLCQGVAVPSAFFVFSPGGRVRPSTLSYLLSTPLFWVQLREPQYLSVIKTILSSISFCHEYVFRGISVFQVTRMIDW